MNGEECWRRIVRRRKRKENGENGEKRAEKEKQHETGTSS